MFHHTLDFWLLTWAGNWEQLSSFSAYPGSLAQQKYKGTWWPQHKSCFLYCLPATPVRRWHDRSCCRESLAHHGTAPHQICCQAQGCGKLSPGTEAAASPTAFPKEQKSWTSALTQRYLQTQSYDFLCLQLLNQGLAHGLIGPLTLITREF